MKKIKTRVAIGKWEVVRSLTCGHLRAAHHFCQDGKKEFTDGDIQAINALPEMLAACEAILAGDQVAAVRFAHEAIKKSQLPYNPSR